MPRCIHAAFICLIHILCAPCLALAIGDGMLPEFSGEDDLNIYCLRLAYPQVDRLLVHPDGQKWLSLKNGTLVSYDTSPGATALNASIAESMAQPYPLEPSRPPTPQGTAPGRMRPYNLLRAIYGGDANSVRQQLKPGRFLGKSLMLSANAAMAFAKAIPELEKLATDKNMRPFLKPEGGYYWRKIAGETDLSPHSFGIAIDLGVDRAPYWRWNKKMPHPMQRTYPREIVEIMEKHGFIWGGKWHEYDLMHFEYRPELVCKATMLQKIASRQHAR